MNIVKALGAGLVAVVLSGCIYTETAVFPLYGERLPEWQPAQLNCTGRYAKLDRSYALAEVKTTLEGARYTLHETQEDGEVMNDYGIAFTRTHGKYIITLSVEGEEDLSFFFFADVNQTTITAFTPAVQAAESIAAQHAVSVQSDAKGDMWFSGTAENIKTVLLALAEQDQFQSEVRFSCTKQ